MSSSSSFSDPQWVYDVFINFRGDDTRSTFVSHLYAALSNAGINAFIDQRFSKGIGLASELPRAIEGSQMALVVFSENYTESGWCLWELEKIMECHRTHGKVVVPIFYDVDPSVVRNQTGAFGRVLEAAAEKRYCEGNIESSLPRWKRALTEAANLTGWDMTNYRSTEAELVREIVNDVWAKLDNTLLFVAKFPVGLESRVQKVVGFIENQTTGVCMVGIWGMGGLGKTTTAKAIYNKIHRDFENKSFIENIREVSETDSRWRIYLQEQLLSDVLKRKVKVHSAASGTTLIEKRLHGKRALIVLDDVNKLEQLDALCGNLEWIGSGSVLIVTTRDVRILYSLKVHFIYKMEELNQNESLELFSRHAFREASPILDFTQLSKNVVAYCGGLPLALEVLGAYLHRMRKEEWTYVLSKLKQIPNDQVQEKLRISFDGLRDELEKDIFLDICSFFIGKDRAYVTEILNGCRLHADVGITILIESSLMKVDKNNKIGMHDLLRDMGREIIRESSTKEPGKRSRLWFHEDVLDILTKKAGTQAIEGLALKLCESSSYCFEANAFKEMNRLRLLQLACVQLKGDFEYFSKELRWVYWQGFHLKYIPDNFYLGSVVAIDLKHSNLVQVWKEPQFLKRLKILNLSHSKYLKITPDFSKLPNLEKLILKDCPSLSTLPHSIGDLHNLLLLNLEDCTNLSNLPWSTYELKSVKTLILSGCSKIEKLEEEIVQMESLTTLIAENTAIKQVPFSIVRSKSIGYISLCGYKGLSHDIFPYIIRSWMSPTMNPLSHIHPFRGLSSSPAFMDVQNYNLADLAPMLSSLSKLRSVLLQCDTQFQVSNVLTTILGGVYGVNFTKLKEKSYTSQTSKHFWKSYLIGIGSYHAAFNTLNNSIAEVLRTNESSDVFLPGNNYPHWLAHVGEGHSVYFVVPQDRYCHMKGMALCVVYSSNLENVVTECISNVFIVNYTKCTIQIYKQDTRISFDDKDWKGIRSNLEPNDKVEIFVTFGHGLIVKKTAVYLMYFESVDKEPKGNALVRFMKKILTHATSLGRYNGDVVPGLIPCVAFASLPLLFFLLSHVPKKR